MSVVTFARLIQYDNGNFETEDAGYDHEWDNDSIMWCRECGYSDRVKAFDEEGHDD